ncbi:TraB/GumN family protein [Steroidobacter agaridevorans]|uniref:TraB/GumN family protein n=1 Tax=Steroidobacter agaridevorans TaxID=2695856 RepID=UPI0013255B97|nr:TraB/GumN family protein [Steroidobacter agaridevorans]GFE85262.1 GumN protein [Steroidobacter agaridevorans]
MRTKRRIASAGVGSVVFAWLLQAALFDACASEAEVDARTPVGVPEEVLVLGEQPGPGLWKVSKGSHTLWILGTYVPTPRGMVWRSKQVEAVIAASDEVLGPYSASLRVKDQKAYQSRRGQLKDVLPRKVYARWRTLRDKYIGEDPETEKLLPTAAALLLRSRAFEGIGLSYADDVWRRIYAVAGANAVPIRGLQYEMGPVTPDKNSSRRSRENSVRYLVETMDRLETDMTQARARANAWATGDMAELQTLVDADASYAQSLAYSWPFLGQEQVEQLQLEAENKLLSALERALNRNETTLVVLPIHVVSRGKGVVAGLRAAGYGVEDPR